MNFRDQLPLLRDEVIQLKKQNRETGRVLFDVNEQAREECMRGLVEAKKKLQLFSEVIEYLDDQAKEARKAVFNKNNQIGNYVNQVRQLEHEIDELSKRNVLKHLEKKNDELVSQIEQQKEIAQQHEYSHEKVRKEIKLSHDARMEVSPPKEPQISEPKPQSDTFWSSFAEEKERQFLEKKSENPYSKPKQEDSGIPFKLDSIVNSFWGVFDVSHQEEVDDKEDEVFNIDIKDRWELQKEKEKPSQQVHSPKKEIEAVQEEQEKIDQDDFALKIKQKQQVTKIKQRKPEEKKDDILEIKEEDDFFSSFKLPDQKKIEKHKDSSNLDKPREVKVEPYEETKQIKQQKVSIDDEKQKGNRIDIPQEVVFHKKNQQVCSYVKVEQLTSFKEEHFVQKEDHEDFELLDNEPNAWDDDLNIDIDDSNNVEVTLTKKKESLNSTEKEEKQISGEKHKHQSPEFDFLDKFNEQEQEETMFDFDKIFKKPSVENKEVEKSEKPKEEIFNESNEVVDDPWADQEIDLGELEQEELQLKEDDKLDAKTEDILKEDQETAALEIKFNEEADKEIEHKSTEEIQIPSDDQKQTENEAEDAKLQEEEPIVEDEVNMHIESLQNSQKEPKIEEKIDDKSKEQVSKT